MKKVVIESPYSGDVEENQAYARLCLRHSLLAGEAPIASHLLHTQVLQDCNPSDRERGIDAGHAWIASADVLAVYMDRGFSKGMILGIIVAAKAGTIIEFRSLDDPMGTFIVGRG